MIFLLLLNHYEELVILTIIHSKNKKSIFRSINIYHKNKKLKISNNYLYKLYI